MHFDTAVKKSGGDDLVSRKSIKRKERAKKWLLRLGQLYLAFFVVWVALRFLVQDAVWWVALLNAYPFLVTFPALILLILLFLAQHRALATIFVLLLMGLFILNFGRLFWPNDVAEGGGETFTAVTYNIQFNNEDDEAIIDSIRQMDADIIGLQEVLSRKISLFDDALAEKYPYRLFTEPEFLTDVALLSKYPIVEVVPFTLQPRRMSLHAIINVEGQPVHVIVVHLTPTQLGSLDGQSLNLRVRERFTIRFLEVTEIIHELQKIDEPVIVLCDCNFAETSQVYRQLDEQLDEVQGEIGWGFGKSNGEPFVYQRVDYIWYSPELVPTAVSFGEQASSDHKPVMATFQFAR